MKDGKEGQGREKGGEGTYFQEKGEGG